MKGLCNLAGTCLSAALLAACAGNGLSPSAPTSVSPRISAEQSTNALPLTQENVIYTFQGGSDGGIPYAGLLAGPNGEFYGTTFEGGTNGGYGTVFKLSPSGTKTILYTFQGGTDGAAPEAGVILKNGVLYGNTSSGGGATVCTGGCGTVFALTPVGSGYTERVLYAFQGGSDGAYPIGGLLTRNGALYGTTASGGGSTACTGGVGSGCGTVFRLTPSGSGYTETVLHRFQSGNDGAGPRGSLIADNKGALYDTTLEGGTGTACAPRSGSSGCGTVFKLTPSSSGYAESIIYNFQGGAKDGEHPRSALLAGKKGTFYGATFAGGPKSLGTVFELTRSGSSYAERVLYYFKGGKDGASPKDENGLYSDMNAALYGTTLAGGEAACSCGTVFKLTPSGSGYAETLLHSFNGGSDGVDPRGSLAADKTGVLYGTTFLGGNGRACAGGCGIVFTVSP